ncbi:hypothetical protein U9M48_008882 [Paspalum notatum var. saurae]|uniref:Uncharacterized protein n=1 Tax=Paspalum notatum var. saurae TaxID=547442 RepID=A0AAQ3SPX6_PASNO
MELRAQGARQYTSLRPRKRLALLDAQGSSARSSPWTTRCGDGRHARVGEPLREGAGARRSTWEPLRVGPRAGRRPLLRPCRTSPPPADACRGGSSCGSARWRWRTFVGWQPPSSSFCALPQCAPVLRSCWRHCGRGGGDTALQCAAWHAGRGLPLCRAPDPANFAAAARATG